MRTKGTRSPGGDRELPDRRHVLPLHLGRRAEAEPVRAGDRDQRVVVTLHPRDDVAVVEADHELRSHRHRPVDALDDADDVRSLTRAAA